MSEEARAFINQLATTSPTLSASLPTFLDLSPEAREEVETYFANRFSWVVTETGTSSHGTIL